MSLINQMLQDLDARKVAHGAGSGLPNEVRPLPKVQASRWPVLLAFIVMLLLVGASATYFWVKSAKVMPPVTPPEPISVVPPVLPPPAPEPEKLVPPGIPPVEPQAVVSELQELDGSLRMADILNLPAEKKAAKKVTEERKDSTARPSVPPATQVPLTAVKADLPTVNSPAKPPLIEKTDALASPRDRAEAEYRKAITAVNQGRIDEALAVLRNALRQETYHLASRQLLVKLLLEAKRPDEAIQVLQDGLQGQPAQLGWAMSLARLQTDRGDLAGAWQTLNYSQPAAANNADYQGFSGHVLQRLGRPKEAVEYYLAAARLSPTDGRWWLGLGLSLEADGRASEAKEAFQHAKQSGNLSAELMALVEQKLR